MDVSPTGKGPQPDNRSIPEKIAAALSPFLNKFKEMVHIFQPAQETPHLGTHVIQPMNQFAHFSQVDTAYAIFIFQIGRKIPKVSTKKQELLLEWKGKAVANQKKLRETHEGYQKASQLKEGISKEALLSYHDATTARLSKELEELVNEAKKAGISLDRPRSEVAAAFKMIGNEAREKIVYHATFLAGKLLRPGEKVEQFFLTHFNPLENAGMLWEEGELLDFQNRCAQAEKSASKGSATVYREARKEASKLCKEFQNARKQLRHVKKNHLIADLQAAKSTCDKAENAFLDYIKELPKKL